LLHWENSLRTRTSHKPLFSNIGRRRDIYTLADISLPSLIHHNTHTQEPQARLRVDYTRGARAPSHRRSHRTPSTPRGRETCIYISPPRRIGHRHTSSDEDPGRQMGSSAQDTTREVEQCDAGVDLSSWRRTQRRTRRCTARELYTAADARHKGETGRLRGGIGERGAGCVQRVAARVEGWRARTRSYASKLKPV
jgi:hypothetical protein